MFRRRNVDYSKHTRRYFGKWLLDGGIALMQKGYVEGHFLNHSLTVMQELLQDTGSGHEYYHVHLVVSKKSPEQVSILTRIECKDHHYSTEKQEYLAALAFPDNLEEAIRFASELDAMVSSFAKNRILEEAFSVEKRFREMVDGTKTAMADLRSGNCLREMPAFETMESMKKQKAVVLEIARSILREPLVLTALNHVAEIQPEQPSLSKAFLERHS